MEELRKNQILTVTIDGWSSEAQGVCHVDGRAIFVPGAIPGEEWEIKLLKVGSSAIYARGEKLLLTSPARVEPDCPCAGKCGGCDTRHMRYEEELRFKLDRVNAALQHIGKQNLQATEVLGSDETARYRNKAIFAVAQVDGQAAFGFYRERSHDLIPIDRCLLQSELSCRCAAAVVDFLRAEGLSAYDEASGRGTVRHVFCRQARQTGDAVLCISSASGFGAKTAALTEYVRSRCPELTGIVLNINKSRGNTVLSGDFYTLWGEPMLHDRLCGLEFSIAPQAFFQINPPQAERLYEKAAQYAAAGKDDLLFDLYCGAGTISLRMARDAGRVIGAEIVPEAVENARENAARNGVGNAEFLCGDAGEAAKALAQRGLQPRVVVVDPPRKGMSEDAVSAVASMAPERVVYVSCNPATLARDILRFQGLGYTLQAVTAVDMFPRTCHVETVALLCRKGIVHHMNLNPDPFKMIKNGQKTIELRLYDEKRRKIRPGDEIVFTNTDTGETLRTRVFKLHRFNSFEELYQALPLLQCGYTEEDIAQAQPSDMEQYYSIDEQTKFGVVGIELFPQKGTTDEAVVLLS